MTTHRLLVALVLPLALAACEVSSGGNGDGGAPPGDADDAAPWSGIGPGETIHFTGTEPFWSGESTGSELVYSTPENIDGATIAVERFAGRNGLTLSGELDDTPFDMAVTPGNCSDGMSDRTYPFAVTLQVRSEQRQGCAWTEATPFEGPQEP